MENNQPSTSQAPIDADGEEQKTVALPKERFILQKWHANALWAWDVNVDNCAICRNSIMDRCIDCQANPDLERECTVAWGKCGHAFHRHCIARWLDTRAVCPLDNTEWEYDKYGK